MPCRCGHDEDDHYVTVSGMEGCAHWCAGCGGYREAGD